jgi:hypothetical protein
MYIDNLHRLKLIEVSSDLYYSDRSVYNALVSHEEIISAQKTELEEGREYGVDIGSVRLTELGKVFIRACIRF